MEGNSAERKEYLHLMLAESSQYHFCNSISDGDWMLSPVARRRDAERKTTIKRQQTEEQITQFTIQFRCRAQNFVTRVCLHDGEKFVFAVCNVAQTWVCRTACIIEQLMHCVFHLLLCYDVFPILVAPVVDRPLAGCNSYCASNRADDRVEWMNRIFDGWEHDLT